MTDIFTSPNTHILIFNLSLILIILLYLRYSKNITIQSLLDILVFKIDEICEQNIPHQPAWSPILLTLFFLVFLTNLVGIFTLSFNQYIVYSLTLTVIVSLGAFFVGLYQKKFKLVYSFIPNGLPLLIQPFIFILEFLSFILKPITLSGRLFLNSYVGHLVLMSLQKTIGILYEYNVATLMITIPILSIIQLIELMLGSLQAFLFVIFTSMLIGTCVNEEH